MTGTILRRGLIALGVVLVLLCLGLDQITVALLVGWVQFLRDAVPRVAVAWGGVATALGCVVLIALLGGEFGGWWLGQVAPGRRWRARWTLGLLGGLVLLFMIGIAAAGVVHQVGWLVTAPEGWYGGVGGRTGAIRRTQTVHNLKQIGLALANYEFRTGWMPPGATVDADGRLLHGWQARILSDLDYLDVFQLIQFDRPWDSLANEEATRTPIGIYRNAGLGPEHWGEDRNLSHFAGNPWVLAGDSAWKLAEVRDGLATTVVVGEAAGDFRPWADPNNFRDPRLGINRSPAGFGGPFVGGANFLMADGSVRFLRNGTNPRAFEALCTPRGGETIAEGEY